MVRAAQPRWVVVIGLCLAVMVAAAAGCRGGDSEAEERRYQAALDTFIASLRSRSAALANPVAGDYLNRIASDEPRRESNAVRQFRARYDEFNQTYCQDMKTIGAVISDGPGKLAGYRLDEAWRLAEDLVFDAMVIALLQGALAAPPEKRDQLLTGLGVRAVRDNPNEPSGRGDTEFSGMAALQEEGLLDPNGHFKIPELGTAEYNQYKKWYSGDAAGLAGQVDALVAPTESKMAECLPPR